MKGYVWYSSGSDSTGQKIAEALGFQHGKKTPKLDGLDILVGWGCIAESRELYDPGAIKAAVSSGALRVINHPGEITAARNKLELINRLREAGIGTPGHSDIRKVSASTLPEVLSANVDAGVIQFPCAGFNATHRGKPIICWTKEDFGQLAKTNKGKNAVKLDYFRSLLQGSEYRIHVFRDFSFLSDTRILLFRGPSGCGKTTLLKILSRNLTPDCVDEMLVPNHALMIVQEDALAPWLTGMGNITRFLGVSEDCVRAHPGFEHVKPFLFRRAHQMSYGQRRLVELLRAILSSPGLLCLDEPFSFLDPTSRRIFTRLLLEEDSFLGNSRIVITSHYQEDFENAAVEAFAFDGFLPVSTLIDLNKRDKP